MPGRLRHCSALVLVLTLAACAESPSAPAGNGAPQVTVAFLGQSACTPKPATPCTLEVAAQASDPDGDPLQYAWSGCATGTAANAICTIDRPGVVTATVAVSDGRGHTVTRSAQATGSNQPPGVHFGYIIPFASGRIVLLGNVIDPDEGFLCGRQYCESATATGACTAPFLECTCLAGLEAAVSRTAATGSCTLTLTLKDTWGQVGSPSITFDVANPRLPGLTGGS